MGSRTPWLGALPAADMRPPCGCAVAAGPLLGAAHGVALHAGGIVVLVPRWVHVLAGKSYLGFHRAAAGGDWRP